MMEQNMNICMNLLEKEFVKYKENVQLQQKLKTIILSIPDTLENYQKQIIDKEEKNAKLKRDQKEFKEEFLKTNPYFYISSLSRFFYYDGFHYTIINEDDIQYNLFTCLSENKDLNNVKYKTQANTINEIKRNRSILNSIPEAITIQFVIDSLCPLLFTKKSDLKYFMVIIGGQILKLQQPYVHFIHPLCKNAMTFIEKCIFDTVGVNISEHFKIKYHNHEMSKCRLVRMNTNLERNNSFCDFFKNFCSDFVSVCCYYGNIRYKSEDDYISKMRNKDSKKYILYLSSNNGYSILNSFLKNNFIQSCVNNTISGKEMSFLWKSYINKEHIPNLFSINSLREKLSELSPYDKNNDNFTHIECNFLKKIKLFTNFCQNNLFEQDDELDVGELIDIYNEEYPLNEEIEESVFETMIKHGILNYKMKSSKTIMNISCKLWNKKQEVFDSIKGYRNENNCENGKCYDAYEYYASLNYKYIANKGYFERLFYIIS